MNILSEIIDWLENKPLFWQVGIERLIRNNELNTQDIRDLKEICKSESGLIKQSFPAVDFVLLRQFVNVSSSGSNTFIRKIHNIQNINALSSSSILEFASTGLTAIYGENGTGKSSYTSILKHTCNTRGHKPKITDNIHDANGVGKDKKAEIEYSLDGASVSSLFFTNEVLSSNDLKSIDVFDSYSATHYIDGEDEIAFIPQGMSYIERLAIVLKEIELELQQEQITSNQSKFDLTHLRLDVDTKARDFLDKIDSTTLKSDLITRSQWDQDKTNLIHKLENDILDLRSVDPKKSHKINIEKIARFNILIQKFNSIEEKLITSGFNDKLKNSLNDYVSKLEISQAIIYNTFAELPFSNIGDDSWKLLWESARKFHEGSKLSDAFPGTSEGSTCPLCLQELGEEAKKRLNNFEEFIKNDVQQELKKAKITFENIVSELNNIVFDFSDQEPTILEIESLVTGYREIQSKYLEELQDYRKKLFALIDKKLKTDIIPQFSIPLSAKQTINDLIKVIENENEKLENISIEDELKPMLEKLAELQQEKKIYEYRPKIGREIFRQKRLTLIQKCITSCNTRTLTTFSNQLANRYITQSLKDNFQLELEKFGFNNIRINTEFKGIKGKQYHYLKLDEPNTSHLALKDILSEGEHRCISLSTFFAELALSDHHSSIIFDDPVSSLDHKWRNKIAKRIVEESKIRQVIVFTHDLTFLLMIQEHAEKSVTSLEIKSLTRKKVETGIIAINPPWDALPVSKRIGFLKNEHQRIEKIERLDTDENYKSATKPLYGQLRESWERAIEEVVLNGAIQRFGREVQTKRLEKIIDLTQEDYKLIDINMSKCSSYFLGHDSSGELIEEIPNAKEFLQDVNILDVFVSSIRSRRNKK